VSRLADGSSGHHSSEYHAAQDVASDYERRRTGSGKCFGGVCASARAPPPARFSCHTHRDQKPRRPCPAPPPPKISATAGGRVGAKKEAPSGQMSRLGCMRWTGRMCVGGLPGLSEFWLPVGHSVSRRSPLLERYQFKLRRSKHMHTRPYKYRHANWYVAGGSVA